MSMPTSLARLPWTCLLTLAVCVATAGIVLSPAAAASSKVSSHLGDRQSRDYIVVLKASVDRPGAVASEHMKKFNGHLIFVYRYALKGYAATLSETAADELRSDPRVKHMRFDHSFTIAAQTIPTGIKRTFASTNQALDIDGVDDARVDADIAIIDSGIDYTHPDLNVVGRTNCVPSNEDPAKRECIDGTGGDGNSHGTHVAGIAGAIDNGIGVTGVAPGTRLWGVRVTNNFGKGKELWLTAGIDWVTAHSSDIEVANMSIGCEVLPCSLPTASEALAKSIEKGVVYTVAAGNNKGNASQGPFGTNPDILLVSALADFDGEPEGKAGKSYCREVYETYQGGSGQADDSLAKFSNYGSAVDIAAPGVCIISTVPRLLGEYEEVDTPETTWSGTSMAAPHVAGAAALLASKSNPNSIADVREIRNIIINAGNANWTDTSGDGVREPLLDVGNSAAFRLGGLPVDSWGVPPTPNPDGAIATELLGVSCTSRIDCTSVGFSRNSSKEEQALAHGWDGSKWSTLPAITNSGSKAAILEDVSCQEPVECVTVGYQADSTGKLVTLAEARDNKVWWVQTTPNPAGAKSAQLRGVSCVPAPDISLTTCVAVGGYVNSSGQFRPLGLRWNGEQMTWFLSTPVTQTGATSLYDVSCPDIDWCMAVGSYRNSSNKLVGMSQIRTGGAWSNVTTATPAGAIDVHLNGISCMSRAACIAVGYYTTSSGSYPLVERWDDNVWGLQTVPNPPTAVSGKLADVSCSSTSACTASGQFSTGGAYGSMVARWDGSSWTQQPIIVNPGIPPAGFSGISCTAFSACVSVGSFNNALNVPISFAEHRFPPSTATFLLRDSNSSGAANYSASYNAVDDIPLAGDWDGNGTTTIGSYRGEGSKFYLRNTNSTGSPDIEFSFGVSGDVPLVGDWDNDGKETIGVYRPTTSTFYLRNSNSSGPADETVTGTGIPGDVPLVGDWDGDGDDTVGNYRPTTRVFYLKNTNTADDADYVAMMASAAGIPLVGDWNGDGTETIGIYDRATWYLRNTNDFGGADIQFSYGSPHNRPIVGDWDGIGPETPGVVQN